MGQEWLEIEIAVPAAAIELLGQALLELGSTGVTVLEQALDSFEHPGELPLPEGEIRVRAYFPDMEGAAALCIRIEQCLTRLKTYCPDLVPTRPTFRRLADEDWAHDWQQHFQAFTVGDRLLIKPSWSERPVPAGSEVLILDPGQAFGTGTHATTALCLEVIACLADSPQPPHRVLDVGTGSGILAMAAAALGAQRVLACDIDAEALRVTRDNVHLNRLDDRVTVVDQPLAGIDGRFDLVLANILAGENIRLAAEFLGKMRPNSHLVLSGILNNQEEDIMQAYQALPLTLTETVRREGWSCLVYTRHG